MSCTVNANTDGKPSVLYKQLVEILKDEELAKKELARTTGKEFIEKFGDYETSFKDGFSEDMNLEMNDKISPRVHENGEPKLFQANTYKKSSNGEITQLKEYNQWYFKMRGGMKHFINKVKFPGITSEGIDEVSKYLLYSFVNRYSRTNLEDISELKNADILNSIETAMASYIEQNKDNPQAVDRAKRVLLSKEDFREEVINKLEDLGIKYRRKLVQNKAEKENDDIDNEDDAGGGINLKETFEKDPKDTSSIRIKLMLSQIPDAIVNEEFPKAGARLVSKYGLDPKSLAAIRTNVSNGMVIEGFTEQDMNDAKQTAFILKPGDYLGKAGFVEFKEVHETLMPILSDIVSYNTGNGITDIFALMYQEVSKMSLVKPWVSQLLSRMRDMKTLEKKAEFVQAFSKVKLNFYVTEYNSETKDYIVINATATNSKDSQIRNDWNNEFRKRFLSSGVLSTEGKKNIQEIQKSLKDTQAINLEEYKRARATNNERNVMVAVANASQRLLNVVNQLGSNIELVDFRTHVRTVGGDKVAVREMNALTSAVDYTLKYILNPETKFTDANGETTSPFDNQDYIKLMSKAQALFKPDMADSNVLANKGKSYHSFTSPSYIHNTVNQFKGDKAEMEALTTSIYNSNSRWLNYFLNTEKNMFGELIATDPESRDAESKRRIEKIEVGLSTSFKSKGKNDGVDVKEVSYVDALNDSVTKVLGHKAGKKSYAQTIIPADKGRKIEFEGMPTFDSKIDYADGEFVIPEDTLNVYVNYFEDEYNRMKEVSNELESLQPHELIEHYHIGAKNGLKSQLFPELSPDNMDKDSLEYAMLYDKSGLPLGKSETGYELNGITDEQRIFLKEKVRQTLQDRLNEAVEDFDNSTAIHVNAAGGAINLSLDDKILKAYKDENRADPVRALIADHFVNSSINTIEYNKMFLGDPAYFKNMPDMIKRTPASYTDGLPMYLQGTQDYYFNQATVDGVEITSKYVDLIRDSLEPGDKHIADAYDDGKVNSTDAQAWITPERWMFIKKRLGQWTPKHDDVYRKMNYVNPVTGTVGQKLTPAELKLAAQPLKGVYFEINSGRPVYLKYSQAVLIPQLVSQTPMQKLYDKMTKDSSGLTLPYEQQVHEVVTIDGVKVGAVAPTGIHEKDGSIKASFDLNTVKLKNRGWKLQQDLPTKTVHETMVGSQIQKNILAGIDISTPEGLNMLQQINDTVSKLSDIGKDNIIENFGVEIDPHTGRMNITNMSRVYATLIDDYKSKGGNDNIVAALEKGLPFDAIPQIGNKVENIFMSIMNKELTKIYTSGGSFIQVSPFGLDEIFRGKDSELAGVKIVSDNYDGKGLKPPHYDPITGEYKPGQCFMPHSTLIKLLPAGVDPTTMTGKELMQYINPEVLQLVGYRIPNQGLSSNDALEIVGILPEGSGDQIVAYDAVPTKTGSDFDIDKMYVMMPNLYLNEETGQIEKVPSDDPTNPLSIQNKLIDLYKQVLLSKYAYGKVMTSIDASFLKDDIAGSKTQKGLFESDPLGDLQFYAPSFQLRTKFEYLSGKMGVAQTANQLVDHVLNRSQNIRLNGYLGIGHKASDGNTKFDNEKDTNNEHAIADAVSAFLNAYVDIAKDPYISRGNHNDVTSAVTFMLLRAGVPISWVNRFIGQPILKELVEEVKNAKGITSGSEGFVPMSVHYENLIMKYGFGDLNGDQSMAEQLFNQGNEFLENNIFANNDGLKIEQFSQEGKDSQYRVLSLFKFFSEKAKFLNESVQASKTPDYGDMSQLMVAKNKFLNVIEQGEILGFAEKFTDTMTGTYKRNGIDWIDNLVKDNNMFLSANPLLQGTINSISSRTGKGERATNEDMVKDVTSAYYSYITSGFKLFKDNRDNMQKLFVELPGQVEELKKTSKNFLIQELEIRQSGLFRFLKINSKNKPKVYSNKITRAWMDLLRSGNKDMKQLGVDLAKYAYSQSGFKNNLNQFFAYMPHEILMAYGIDDYIIKANSSTNMELSTDDNFREQMFRHNSDNRQLVPLVGKKKISTLAKGHLISTGFVYTADKDSLFTGATGDGFNTYPEFVALSGGRDPYTNEKADDTLYKLVGTKEVLVDIGDGVKDYRMRPVYVRTFKLGTKSNHGSIFEYSRDKKISKSVIKANNLSDEQVTKQKEFITFAKESSTGAFVDANYVLNPDYENKAINPSIEIKKEDTGEYSEYNMTKEEWDSLSEREKDNKRECKQVQ